MNKIPTAQQLPPNPGAANVPRRRRGRTAIIIAVVVTILLTLVWWVNHRQAAQGAGAAGPGGRGGGRRGGFGGGNAPLPVGVRPAEKGDIHIYLSALGTVVAAHAATIRTQISGQLQQIAFQEGQLVHQGDLLAVIDPRPFENSLQQAQAQYRQAESQLHTAELDLQRFETLAKEDSIAKQQVDNARAQVNQFQGAVEAAQAAINTANLNLTYCHIKAPFDGRVGLRLVDTGNYVTPGDSNGLVTLAQTKPITVVFTLPEDNMGVVAARLHRGAKLPVDLFDRTQNKQVAAGTLATIDNQIDPTTGTFKLRADFPNEDESLFPNQFVNVRLLINTVTDATVIPTSAVERGQQGTYVYIVDENETAVARPITLGDTEGERVAVTSGLTVGDKIVTDGADKLKDGQKVILTGPESGAGEHRGPETKGERPGGANGKKRGPRGEKKAGGGEGNKD
jgi:membrane fusion protein, multidrug efflux system